MVGGIPLRSILVPVAHDLVDPSTIQTTGQAADVIREMTAECSAGRRQFQPARDAIDVAVEGLHHAENELAHAFTRGAARCPSERRRTRRSALGEVYVTPNAGVQLRAVHSTCGNLCASAGAVQPLRSGHGDHDSPLVLRLESGRSCPSRHVQYKATLSPRIPMLYASMLV